MILHYLTLLIPAFVILIILSYDFTIIILYIKYFATIFKIYSFNNTIIAFTFLK